jgi:hypothetical protein
MSTSRGVGVARCRPSNLGTYLAGLGIPATAGFGIDHVGLHATDERIRLDTIPTSYCQYLWIKIVKRRLK